MNTSEINGLNDSSSPTLNIEYVSIEKAPYWIFANKKRKKQGIAKMYFFGALWLVYYAIVVSTIVFFINYYMN